MKKTALALALISVLAASLLWGAQFVRAGFRTIIVPNDYPTITAAIGSATDGNTLLIKSGTYTEQTLEINKSLTIKSEIINGAKISLHPPQFPVNWIDSVIMVYNNSIRIDADDVKLTGFVITSDGGDISANGNQIQLINNTIGTERTRIGVYITGNGSQVLSNTASTLIIAGSNNTVADNQAAALSVTGSFNLVTRNNAGSIALVGSRNTVTGNSFIGDTGVGIYLINADYDIITDNIEAGGNVGSAIGYANPGGSYNIFAGNTVEEAGLWGILLGNGSYNVFYGNRIANNGGLGHDGYGLALGGNGIEAKNNLFFHNILANNAKNFGANWDIIGSNSFDNGTEGNYWDDYLTRYPNATELDHSGIGNTPYLVYANNMDNYPLMNKPDVSSIVPALPTPWSSLLPITSSIERINPPSPSSSQQESETFSTVLTAAGLGASAAIVGVGMLIYSKKRQRGQNS